MKLVRFLGQIDLIKSNAKTAKEYNYVQPKIIESKKGFINIY